MVLGIIVYRTINNLLALGYCYWLLVVGCWWSKKAMFLGTIVYRTVDRSHHHLTTDFLNLIMLLLDVFSIQSLGLRPLRSTRRKQGLTAAFLQVWI